MPNWCSPNTYKKLFAEISARDGMLCYWCKRAVIRYRIREREIVPKDAATLDHVQALAEGGAKLDPQNIVMACFDCNCNVRSSKISKAIVRRLRVAAGKPDKPTMGTRGRRRRRRLINRTALEEASRWEAVMQKLTAPR